MAQMEPTDIRGIPYFNKDINKMDWAAPVDLPDEEFAKLPYKEKDTYMSVYVKMDKPLSYEQFVELPEDLKNKYVGFGVGLSNEQFESIKSNSKLVKRYAEISNRKFDEYLKFEKDQEDEVHPEDSRIKFTDSETLFIDKDKFNKMTDNTVLYLLNNATDRNKIGNIILKYKGENLTDANIRNLITNLSSEDQIQRVNAILNFKIKNNQELTDNDVKSLFYFSKDKDQIANVILKYKGDNLTDSNVTSLLGYSENPDQMANVILKYKEENNQELTDDNIFSLIFYSQDKDQMKNILLQYKTKEEINKVIIDRNFDDIGLIPESNSIHNFRKTIRQLIKENYKQ
jgi:hypothetical protein